MKRLTFAEVDGQRALVLPAQLGDILWYIEDGRMHSARVFEIKITLADAGHCCEDIAVFAWNGAEGRQLTWCPLQGEAWMDRKGEYVEVFTRREAAETALYGGGEKGAI